MPPTRLLLAPVCLALILGACGGGGGGGDGAPRIIGPPGNVSITFDPALPALLRTGDVFEGTVSVSNPDLHLVTVRLENPPPGCFFEAGHAVPPGDARRLRWTVPAEAVGAHRLQFFAAGHVEAGPTPSDDLQRERRVSFDTRVEVGTRRFLSSIPTRSVQMADVTGDGTMDLVALVPLADVGTTVDAGVVLVWVGISSPGGPADGELRAPNPVAGDRIGGGAGATLQLADVTGDGRLDVLVGSPHRDVGGVVDAGSVLVWRGGGGLLTGTPSPVAEFRRAAPQTGDGADMRFKVMDCTGDGIRDVVIHMPEADTTADDVGVVMVAAGGPNPGAAAPVELTHPFGAQAGLRLGQAGDGDGLQLADLTGDGKAELLLPAPAANLLGGLNGAGSVLLWRHVGAPGTAMFTTARQLLPADIEIDMALGRGIGLRTGDVTGDGIDDVVTASSRFGDATFEMGQASVWAGGNGLATGVDPVAPVATLRPASELFDGHLGEGPGGLQLGDVTGDGVRDVVAAAPSENSAQGAIYVWAGGSGLVAHVLPTVRLADPNGLPSDGLAGTMDLPSPAFHLVDLTGDAVLDVLSAAPFAGALRFVEVGLIHLWAGGASISAAPQATLALTTPSSGAHLGRSRFPSGAAGISLMDLTGDGLPEILGLAADAPHDGVAGAGVIGIWRAGPALAGLRTEDALLVDPTPLTDGHLGAFGGDHPLLADLTGDRVPELVASAHTVGGSRLLVWSPGTSPTGALLPVASHAVDPLARLPHAVAGDLDGDGVADLAFTEQFSLTQPQSSAVRLMLGGTPLDELLDLDEPFALVAQTSAVAIVLGDMTGDHRLDIVVGAAGDEVDGQPGAGRLRLHDLSFGDQDDRLEARLRRLVPRALDNLGN